MAQLSTPVVALLNHIKLRIAPQQHRKTMTSHLYPDQLLYHHQYDRVYSPLLIIG